jgi:hypothetical protein
MYDATGFPSLGGVLFEHDYVSAVGSLKLDEAVFPEHLDSAEHLAIEARCSVHVTDGERDVREPESVDHGLSLADSA